ncbi:MAG: YceI family protein [Chloroflexi bacterium]|nr:YceI family protein [Chloroflexota bacterium]
MSTTTTWKLDPAHTDILFSAKHMMITTVRGTFTDVDGILEIDETNPLSARGEIKVQAASLDTGVVARDTHLRSADFFDVERFPEIVIQFAEVDQVKPDEYRVAADLTIRGITRQVTFEVEPVGETTNFGGNRHIAFAAQATLNRDDWGLNWNRALESGGWLVGKDIKLNVEVVADEVVADEAVPAPATAGKPGRELAGSAR